MTFFDRYALLMEEKGLDPGSQSSADMMGVTRSAISIWKKKGNTPKGDTVAKMADVLRVSADYLLGRTTDPTDYARKGSGKVVPIRAAEPAIMKLYSRLDSADRMKAEGVIQGMLMQDKYTEGLKAAHVRTDIDVTDEMIAADDAVMDDSDF